jgi:hypothetical protein
MRFDPIAILTLNAAAQVLVSSLLGWLMLIPLQPWGGALKKLDLKSLRSTHLDWLMLAFMQWGAAFVMSRFPHAATPLIAVLLVFGGWTNALPYLLRGFGINAFALAGPPKQFISAAISALSSLAITVAWAMLLLRTLR